MPNQSNFRSDVTTRTEPRYLASRIVRFPEEEILLEEIPASIGFDREDHIEIHFYTIPNNILILSTVVTLMDGVLKSHIVKYNDGTFKNYIRIDFTKLLMDKRLLLVPGDYRMTLNYFSEEIGGYYDRKLTVDKISETRTEVQLSFNDSINEVIRQSNSILLREFVEKSFNKTDAVGFVEKVFKSGVKLNDPTEGLIAQNIIGKINPQLISRVERLGLREIFEKQINDFLLELFEFIREEIVINGDQRIQGDEFMAAVSKVVSNRIVDIRTVLDQRIKIS